MKDNAKHRAEELTAHNSLTILTYPIKVSALSDEDGGGYHALYSPLARSVVGYGATEQEALADLKAATPLFLDVLATTGQRLAELPTAREWEDYSGKFNVRVAKVLHAQLSNLANEQGVSLNSLVQSILASGATALAGGHLLGAHRGSDANPH